ncbi:hypothetical protein EDB81DRAFT_848069 [Dactylonectria macrodidyma]|uniref:Uncharacterized protein n=1 Tax=Dactylonectria macrodidyma TaxID=307937 RepID=A0A9P9IFR6_9HYPO|nr:hypothetical protein EDB81DRAFT_848069 [Dactylonectria macrodidyma]
MTARSNSKVDEDRREEMLKQVRTARSIQLPPGLFEHLYLSSQNSVKGNLWQIFGNPTPIALAGLLLCSTPVSLSLLGWQSAGSFLARANVGAFFYIGGLLLGLGGVEEWILSESRAECLIYTANSLPCQETHSQQLSSLPLGGFWLTTGSTIVPEYGAYGICSTGAAAEGLKEPQFYATFALFLVGMTIRCAIFTIACVRTNLVFLLMFLLLLLAAKAGTLLAATILGWYNFLALVLLSVNFPLTLPLGDLSTVIMERAELFPLSDG